MENTQPNVKEEVNRCMIKKQTVKHMVKSLNCQVGHDLYTRLDGFIEKTLVTAAQRARCNGRKTLRGIDL